MHRLPDLLCIKLEHVHVGLTSGEVGTSSTLVYHFYVEKIDILATRDSSRIKSDLRPFMPNDKK